ncbi:hypothetical protein, partial [Streptomyces griseorubiginosus]|uniref:hypothetical protein n=1 Tax=Streptomyces griseorubiginosus TaxID=67304 RepID=UPI00340917B3
MEIRFEDQWRPEQHTGWADTSDLAQGDVVVVNRQPFRIDRVDPITPDNWPQDYVDAWLKAGMPDADTWATRPMRVHGFFQQPGADPRRHSTAAPASHHWDVLPEHYSVCHACLEIPPCKHVHDNRVMRNATRRMSEAMAILPGTCHACKEPISKRQKAFTFPGSNLIRPDLGDHSAIFHTRGKCAGAMKAYDKRWAAAEEGRARFFHCAGNQTIHYDQSTECSNPECTAKGELADWVEHNLRVWHHPQG